MLINLVLYYCLLKFLDCVYANDFPEVKIKDGVLRGTYMNTKNNRKFSAFLGIPYAKPPLGPLRFQPPIQTDPWAGVLNATEIHAICPQKDVFRRSSTIEGQEDCLYLNVYTPKISRFANDPLPVMIFFHGGGWLCGGGNSQFYGPEILLDRDIVLVVTNYRLGALGFLSTGDGVVPGNNGLKDQSLALKWTKKNIAKFGGDSESITIFGESAGGASSHLHMFSPLNKGLFKGAILQSGTALCKWALAEKGEEIINSKKLAKLFNCPTDSSHEMVECLREVDANSIIEQDKQFMVWDYDPILPFKPVIEPKVAGAFLIDHPINLIKSRDFIDVPIIVGLNTEEGALKVAGYASKQLYGELDNKFNEIAPLTLLYYNEEEIDLKTETIRNFYYGKKKIDESSVDDIINMYTDSWFLRGADSAIRMHTQYSRHPVYYYLFGYRGSSSFTKIFNGGDTDYGVCHVDELQYLFPLADVLFPDIIPSETDKKVSNLMTTLWTNFARYGNPTPEINDVIPEKWNPTKSGNEDYYYIDSNSTGMRSGLLLERAKFWRSLTTYNNINIRDEL